VTHSGEEYAPWLQVQIHEVECDATLQVSVYAADGDLIPDVGDSEVREVGLRDRLVNGFVLLDAP